MKMDKSIVVFGALLAVYAFVYAATGDFGVAWLFILAAVPGFCVQLLCCLTKRWWTRLLPVVPVTALLGKGLCYLIDGRGDYLAPLVFALARPCGGGGACLGTVVVF
jgi:hypothetical protein